jgi:endoglucanase
MNKRIKALVLTLAVMVILPMTARAQLPAITYGWNLGNTLEPPCGEGCWSPAATQALINAVAANGFNTIRIPVAWMSHANARTYQIDAAWMARVKQVVDWSRAANLTVIINIHWDGGWFDSNGFRRFDSKLNKKYQTIWSQIANTFRDYDSKLLFCAANEPDVDSAAKTAVLLQYYQTFVNTVRATGGNNATRWLVLPGPSTNIDRTFNWMNSLPTDSAIGRLAIDVHYYDPYQFTIMSADESWGKMFYFWGQGYHSATMTDRNSNWGDEQWLNEQFEKMRTKFVDNGVPVLIGEFASNKRVGYADLTGTELTRHLASRTYFDKQVVDVANLKGLKPIYWDNGFSGTNGCGVFDRITAAVDDPDSLRALTGGVAVSPP